MPDRSFVYPDDHYMCPSGQDRAASEAWILMHSDDAKKESVVVRAMHALFAIGKGADTNKHNLISLAALRAFLDGDIKSYVNPTTGEYLVSSPIPDGVKLIRKVGIRSRD